MDGDSPIRGVARGRPGRLKPNDTNPSRATGRNKRAAGSGSMSRRQALLTSCYAPDPGNDLVARFVVITLVGSTGS